MWRALPVSWSGIAHSTATTCDPSHHILYQSNLSPWPKNIFSWNVSWKSKSWYVTAWAPTIHCGPLTSSVDTDAVLSLWSPVWETENHSDPKTSSYCPLVWDNLFWIFIKHFRSISFKLYQNCLFFINILPRVDLNVFWKWMLSMISFNRDFVEEKLGSKYVIGRSLDFATSFEESGPATPMFFILSPGVDPLKDVEKHGKWITSAKKRENPACYNIMSW